MMGDAMYFESLHELWTMAGHGKFVWAAYGISLIVLSAMVIAPIQRYRKELRGILRRASIQSQQAEV